MIKWDLQWFAEKTEPASAKKRSELRDKGQVARSMDLTMAVNLLAFLFGLKIFGGNVIQSLYQAMQLLLSNGVTSASGSGIDASLVINSLGKAIMSIVPVILIGLLASLLTNTAQTGIRFTPSVLIPDLTKLNPITGIPRVFNASSLVELLKSTVKIIIVGTVVYIVLSRIITQLFQMNQGDPSVILLFYIHSALQLMFTIASVYLVIGILDLFYQRFSFSRRIRMSKEEVKDEFKQMEQDPQIKGEIRKRGRAIALSRMMKNVPTADVIITNPTHYAVALRYDALTMQAPQVVAKGVDNLALRIRELATENDVPIVENRELARTIYNVVEVDEYIPNSLFAAVAEVLAYVYRLRRHIQ